MMYMSMSVMQTGEANQLTEYKLKQALDEMDRLKYQNEKLQKLAVDIKDSYNGKGENNNHNSLKKLQTKLELAKQQLKELTVKKSATLSDEGRYTYF
ncbi:hypothetical protein SNE40_009580 [Patella caerulea]|uniref:Uncharacterized protein n=1 Tax=Patella caerulea TaxID=87958 RepID=A0AAN8PYP1_PATCE